MRPAARSPFAARAATASGPRPPAAIISRPTLRRSVTIEHTEAVLPILPGPGEALHAISTGRRTDITAVVAALLRRHGPATLHVATLSMSRRNLKDMLQWIGTGSTVRLLVSSFFWRHNKAFWRDELLPAFAQRPGCQAAHWRNHAKVVALDFGTGGPKYSLEGSANLRGCDSWENFLLAWDDSLHDFHAAWINDRLTNATREENEE
jgi:hypothetical protein